MIQPRRVVPAPYRQLSWRKDGGGRPTGNLCVVTPAGLARPSLGRSAHGLVAVTPLVTFDAGWYVQPDRDSASTV